MSMTDKISAATKDFEDDLGSIDILNKLEEQTKVPKTAIFLGGASVFSIVVFAAFGPGLFCNLVGFLYPSYASFKAIESVGKDDDTQWLTYWVVYAAFNIIETFTDFLAAWVPFYYPFKFGFLIWCFLPNTRGAQFVYNHVVGPFLKSQEGRIDASLEKAQDVVEDIIDGDSDEEDSDDDKKDR